MEYVGKNAIIGTVAAGVAGAAIGGIVGYSAGKRSSSKKSRKRKGSKSINRKKRNNKNKSRGRKLKFGSAAYRKKYLKHGRKRKTPHTAGKRRDTSRRRIRYTSKGQPYVIGRNGKAKFISKRSAKSSYKRKGGKY